MLVLNIYEFIEHLSVLILSLNIFTDHVRNDTVAYLRIHRATDSTTSKASR